MYFENINNFNDLNDLFGLNNYQYAYNYQNNNQSYLSEKFLRGNMFDNEFIPYKNMKYVMPKIKNEKEQKLSKIMESSFAVIDYVLYLDIHPDDHVIFEKYNTEKEKLNSLKKEYESVYGPLCNTEGQYNSYQWLSSPWPWESDGGMYV
jgi:spore coat protein JB